MKSGFVSIIGRPNVGKSTLLNTILDMKLSITSNVSGTTRNIIEGIYNDEDSQIIFVDTPGIHKPNNMLGTLMNKKAYDEINGVDIILFMIDISRGFGTGDKFILNKLKDSKRPVFLLLNKIDLVKDKRILLGEINALKDLYSFNEIIPLSSKRKADTKELIKIIKKYLPVSERLYSEEELTNVSTKFIMGEFVREELLKLTHDEIPQTVSCYVESFKEEDEIVKISVIIVVDRDNIKKIIIGKNGSMLKEVGSRARMEMEKFLNKKVYLETYVKTLENWRDEEKHLKELGLKEE